MVDSWAVWQVRHWNDKTPLFLTHSCLLAALSWFYKVNISPPVGPSTSLGWIKALDKQVLDTCVTVSNTLCQGCTSGCILHYNLRITSTLRNHWPAVRRCKTGRGSNVCFPKAAGLAWGSRRRFVSHPQGFCSSNWLVASPRQVQLPWKYHDLDGGESSQTCGSVSSALSLCMRTPVQHHECPPGAWLCASLSSLEQSVETAKTTDTELLERDQAGGVTQPGRRFTLSLSLTNQNMLKWRIKRWWILITLVIP